MHRFELRNPKTLDSDVKLHILNKHNWTKPKKKLIKVTFPLKNGKERLNCCESNEDLFLRESCAYKLDSFFKPLFLYDKFEKYVKLERVV